MCLGWRDPTNTYINPSIGAEECHLNFNVKETTQIAIILTPTWMLYILYESNVTDFHQFQIMLLVLCLSLGSLEVNAF